MQRVVDPGSGREVEMGRWGADTGGWKPLAAGVCGLAALALGFLSFAGAQEPDASQIAAAEQALAEQQGLTAHLHAQLDALPDLPGDARGRADRLTDLMRAQERAVAAHELDVARQHHERAAAELARIGRALRAALSAPDEARIDADQAAARVRRLAAREQKLLVHAAQQGLEVDKSALDAAKRAAERAAVDASDPASERGAKRALFDYAGSLQQLEDALLEDAERKRVARGGPARAAEEAQ